MVNNASEIMRTNSKAHPFLAHTPTMRIPFNVQGSLSIILCFLRNR